jgi:hypothetical protein
VDEERAGGFVTLEPAQTVGERAGQVPATESVMRGRGVGDPFDLIDQAVGCLLMWGLRGGGLVRGRLRLFSGRLIDRGGLIQWQLGVEPEFDLGTMLVEGRLEATLVGERGDGDAGDAAVGNLAHALDQRNQETIDKDRRASHPRPSCPRGRHRKRCGELDHDLI